MKHITFWLDFISPYAYLAFEHLPVALEGLSYEVSYKPLLFAGLLKHHGQLGPAEVPGKREWTYRQVLWLAHRHGIEMQMPAGHPFNPLPLLRLAVACGPNRHVCETIFRHVWRGGEEAAGGARLEGLRSALQPGRSPDSAEVKSDLQRNGEDALAHGLFGVPAFTVDDKVFWGFDALPMLRAWMEGDAWFGGPAWETAAALPAAVARPRS